MNLVAKRRSLQSLAVSGAMLALAGCSALNYTLAKTDYQDCQWLRVFAFEPACHELVKAEHATPTADAERFCYRSLGGVDCQAEPDEDRTPVGSG